MPRLMSVALTEQAVIERRKTVTRRKGWKFLEPGERLTLCRKVQGRKPGEPLVRLAEVEVVSVERLPLCCWLVPGEQALEGFPEMTWRQFVDWYAATFAVATTAKVTRIEWRYLEGA